MKQVRACLGALGAVLVLNSCFGGGGGTVDTTLANVELPASNVGAILATVAPLSVVPIVPDATAAPVSTKLGEVPQVAPTLAATAVEVAVALAEAAAQATTTVVVPKESSATLATPDAASRNLWDAWRDYDRPRALQYASVAAVNVLFRDRWRPESVNLGCEQTSAGWRCVYAVGNTGRLLTVIGDDKTGFRVKSVRLLGDVASAAIVDTVTTIVGATGQVDVNGTPVVGLNGAGSGETDSAGVVVDDTGVVENGGLGTSPGAGVPDVAPTIAVSTIPGQTRVVKTTKKKTKTTKKKAAVAASDAGAPAADSGGSSGASGSSSGSSSGGATAGGGGGGDQPVSVANRPVTEIDSGNG